MPIVVLCPSCSNAIKTPDELIGKRIRCKKCATVFPVTPGTESPQSSSAITDKARQSTGSCLGCGQPLRNLLPCLECQQQFCSEMCLSRHYEISGHGPSAKNRNEPGEPFDLTGNESSSFQCPACKTDERPVRINKVSTAGWIFFWVLFLFLCWPICWIGLLLRERYAVCRRWGRRGEVVEGSVTGMGLVVALLVFIIAVPVILVVCLASIQILGANANKAFDTIGKDVFEPVPRQEKSNQTEERRRRETEIAAERERLAEAKRRADEEAQTKAEEAKANAQRESERKRSLPELLQALKERDANTRARAAENLGERGIAAKLAVPDLVGALQDQESVVRRQAAMALGMIGQPAKQALATLVRAVGDADAQVGQAAQQAVDKLGALTKDDLPLLIDALKEKNPAVRLFVVKAMGKLSPDSKPAVPTLIGLLKDPEVSEAAVEALQRIGSFSKTELPALIESLEVREKTVRLFILAAIAEVGSPAKGAVPALVEILKDPDETVRLACLTALEKIGPGAKDAIPGLAEVAKGNDAALRLRAAEVLAALGSFRASDPLIEALKDKDPKVRLRAAAALRKLGPDAWAAVRPLIQLLKDTDLEVRSSASDALAAIGKQAVGALVEGAQKDINSNVRIGCCLALGQIGPDAKEAVPPLRATSTEDRNAEVRKAAAQAIDKIQRNK